MPEILIAGITAATTLLLAIGHVPSRVLPLVSDVANTRAVRFARAQRKQSN
jgi:anaerobic C4-dicarboxylate transporter